MATLKILVIGNGTSFIHTAVNKTKYLHLKLYEINQPTKRPNHKFEYKKTLSYIVFKTSEPKLFDEIIDEITNKRYCLLADSGLIELTHYTLTGSIDEFKYKPSKNS